MEQTSTQITSLSELDNIDVFDFFNYPHISEPPRMSPGQSRMSQSPHQQGPGGSATEAMRMPDPESDWLGYGGQYS